MANDKNTAKTVNYDWRTLAELLKGATKLGNTIQHELVDNGISIIPLSVLTVKTGKNGQRVSVPATLRQALKKVVQMVAYRRKNDAEPYLLPWNSLLFCGNDKRIVVYDNARTTKENAEVALAK